MRDLSPENVKIASRLDVPEHEVVSMNQGSQETTPLIAAVGGIGGRMARLVG